MVQGTDTILYWSATIVSRFDNNIQTEDILPYLRECAVINHLRQRINVAIVSVRFKGTAVQSLLSGSRYTGTGVTSCKDKKQVGYTTVLIAYASCKVSHFSLASQTQPPLART